MAGAILIKTTSINPVRIETLIRSYAFAFMTNISGRRINNGIMLVLI
jgi:hypothetical protein